MLVGGKKKCPPKKNYPTYMPAQKNIKLNT